MLSNQQVNSVLILAFDKVPEEVEDLTTALSGEDGKVTEQETYAKEVNLNEYFLSDVNNKQIRIPIIISDQIMPAQHVASSTSTNKGITYDDGNGKPYLSSLSNNVGVRINLNNSLAKLSTASDIFYAIADQVFPRYTTSPRASFFGATICIFNGYLTGINRSTVDGTDLEVMNLTFERSENNPLPPLELDKTPVNADVPAVEPPPVPDIESLQVTTETVSNPGNANGRLFYWYNLGVYQDLINVDLPEFKGLELIDRLEYTIHKSILEGFDQQTNVFLTVEYNGQYIPLGLNAYYPYYKPLDDAKGYAVTLQEGYLYLGLEAV